MIEFYITDSEQAYAGLSSPKCLIQHGFVKTSDFFSEEERHQINAPSITLDFDAVEKMNAELRMVIAALQGQTFRANAAMQTRETNEDITFSLLFDTFKKIITEKYFLQCSVSEIEKLLQTKGNYQLHFLLTHKMRVAENALQSSLSAHYQFLEPTEKPEELSLQKKFFYRFWQLKNRLLFKNPSAAKKHIAVYLYDSPHYVTLLHRFFELAKADGNIHLSVIKITTGIAASRAANFEALQSPNCAVYDVADFRCLPFQGHKDLWSALSKLDQRYSVLSDYQSLDNLELYYAWIGESMKLLKPDSALFLGHTDMGRAVSDCARLHKVKSVNAEYALIFDAPIMDINIRFDIRASIGETSVQTWKKYNDPSPVNVPIGYLRFDEISVPQSKPDFFLAHQLNPSLPTVFFASTWGAANKIHDEEKGLLCDAISKLCASKNWNFIIKKHPSESDDVVKEILSKNNFPNQRCFMHDELNLNDAIAWSDLVCTQSSSIVLEAIYFEKPFCFVSYYGNRALADYFPFQDEPSLANLKSVDAFEAFAIAVLQQQKQSQQEDFSRLKKKFLFATDAKAAERLLHLLTNS